MKAIATDEKTDSVSKRKAASVSNALDSSELRRLKCKGNRGYLYLTIIGYIVSFSLLEALQWVDMFDGSPLIFAAATATMLMTIFAHMKWSASQQPLSEGVCAFCGYDLRATPDRCPECGQLAKCKSATRADAED